jgi:hypothetical protein
MAVVTQLSAMRVTLAPFKVASKALRGNMSWEKYAALLKTFGLLSKKNTWPLCVFSV